MEVASDLGDWRVILSGGATAEVRGAACSREDGMMVFRAHVGGDTREAPFVSFPIGTIVHVEKIDPRAS